MGVLRVLNGGGDRCLSWDQTQVDAGDPEAAAAVREAERIFAAVQARGGTGVKVGTVGGQAPERITHFDAAAEQIILLPPVVGG